MKLFLPQTTLEEWALEEKADLEDGRLVVRDEKGAWPVSPAVRFVKLVSGEDEKKLLDRVKTNVQLSELGAEHMMDSVLLGENAYEVIPGYLAEVTPSQVTAARPTSKPQSSPEADLLAQFLLNKL